jgi:putative transposase
MKFDPQKHHRRSIRLKGYDYAQPGAYFVTLVTWHRQALFGEVVGGSVRLSALGRIVEEEWKALPRHFPNIRLDAFVVMPNHIHGIIVITDTAVGATRTAPTDHIVRATHPLHPGTSANVTPLPNEPVDNHAGSPLPAPDEQPESRDGSPLRPNGPTPGSLGAIIGQFKSRATKRIWALPEYAHTPIWQRNYYERIIRNETELKNIWNYIDMNPERWSEDQMHPTTPTKPNQDKQHG